MQQENLQCEVDAQVAEVTTFQGCTTNHGWMARGWGKMLIGQLEQVESCIAPSKQSTCNHCSILWHTCVESVFLGWLQAMHCSMSQTPCHPLVPSSLPACSPAAGGCCNSTPQLSNLQWLAGARPWPKIPPQRLAKQRQSVTRQTHPHRHDPRRPGRHGCQLYADRDIGCRSLPC